MINVKKMIKQRDDLKKQFKKNVVKVQLQNFKFSTDIKEIESKIPKIACLIQINEKYKKDFEDILEDILEMRSFKIFLNNEISSIVLYSKFNKQYIKDFVKNKLYPYYEGKFTINMSRELSFLPLDLRIFIYNELLQLEQDFFTCMNYLDRINVTCSKMGGDDNRKLASLVASYNWSIEWGNRKIFDNDSCFIKDIYYINNSERLRKELLDKEDKTSGQYLEELSFSISGFTNRSNIHDLYVAKMITELLKEYFSDISGISDIVSNIDKYLETGNTEYVKGLRNGRPYRNADNERIMFIGNNMVYDPVSNTISNMNG